MLTKIFDVITRTSVRLRWLTLLSTLGVLVAGGWAYTQLNQELVPPVEFPQTFVFTQWSDANDTDEILEKVTKPLEIAFQEIEGVVNVETTTNSAFAITIVRNKFGLDQKEIAADIEEAIEGARLPETAEPDVLTFSLADLPVIAASVSSDQMTLTELKKDINEKLITQLEVVENVARVDIDGGQELPSTNESEAMPEASVNVTPADPNVSDSDTPEVTETTNTTEISALSLPLRLGLRAYDIDVDTVNEITPEYTRILVYQGGLLAMEALNLLTPENLRNAQPASLAYLPSNYTADLDNDLQDELNDVAAEYGGIGQFTIEQAAEAEAEGIDILTGLAVDLGTIDMVELAASGTSNENTGLDEGQAKANENTPEETAANENTPVDLPAAWQQAGQMQGLTLETTDDVTVELIQGLAQLPAAVAAPLFSSLTPEIVAAMSPDVVALIPTDTIAIDEAVAGDDVGGNATLPPAWHVAARALKLDVQTAGDLTPAIIDAVEMVNLDVFDDLTPEILMDMTMRSIAALPASYINSLDTEVIDALTEAGKLINTGPAALNPLLSANAGAISEALGQEVTLDTVDDLTPELVRIFAGFGEMSAQMFALLTPENLRLMSPESLALLPATYVDTLTDDEKVYLNGIAVEYGGVGQLLVSEAEEAAAMAASSPVMSGVWLEPDENGEPSQFQTAADVINNGFMPSAAVFINVLPDSPRIPDVTPWIEALSPEIIDYMVENETGFVDNLEDRIFAFMLPDTVNHIIDKYGDTLGDERIDYLDEVLSGGVEVFIPETSITRNAGNPALVVNVYKEGDANTVNVSHDVFEIMDAYVADNPGVDVTYAFEQASFIEESIRGVTQEGALGALFAILIILIFLSGRINGQYRLSWQATLITALSIPASVLFAFLLMWLVPKTVGPWVNEMAESGNFVFTQLAKLFPSDITLNIMTLSGLTVAIGRVVDDSIVVLENSYRYIQKGDEPFDAVRKGTKEVAVAIFAATVTTMAVFLPLGFVGGVISAFFLPFGLTVTYALVASYIVSITVVPALTYLFIRKENIPEEQESWMQRWYTPVLEWTLTHRLLTMLFAMIIFAGSLFLMRQLPTSFIPGLGDPTVNVSVTLPTGTDMLATNDLTVDFEERVNDVEGIESVLTTIGSGTGFDALLGGGRNISQNIASLTIAVNNVDDIDALAAEVREIANDVFGEDNVVTTAAVQQSNGGFGLVVTGDDLSEIVAAAPDAIVALEALDGDEDGELDMLNVSSNAEAAAGGDTIIRIDGQPALKFTADLQTADTLGVAAKAIDAINDVLPPGLVAAEGFDSQEQAQGFQGMIRAIGVSIILVYLIMALTFRSLVHPFTILFTLPFALVGAAIALFISSSVLGISAMMGLLMLVGVVVTNGIVLLELVQQLRDKGIPTYDALVDAGRTRLRPIWMTALTAILALIPLAFSSKGGAIIASELGRAVMGGLIVSTALTLIVIPVVYSLFDQLLRGGEERKMQQLARRYNYRLNKSGHHAVGD